MMLAVTNACKAESEDQGHMSLTESTTNRKVRDLQRRSARTYLNTICVRRFTIRRTTLYFQAPLHTVPKLVRTALNIKWQKGARLPKECLTQSRQLAAAPRTIAIIKRKTTFYTSLWCRSELPKTNLNRSPQRVTPVRSVQRIAPVRKDSHTHPNQVHLTPTICILTMNGLTLRTQKWLY